jgi:pimeloyl-ACP methyl ester carboxylesterase
VARPYPHVEGVEHRFVDAGSLTMHVAEAGSPDADPLVMLHGWPQHWYEWRHQIPPLARHYRVIAPDLRGFGWSDAPPDGYDKENMATDVLNLLDALGLEQVRLVGHDWGGWIGFLIGLRVPERIKRLVALNIPTPWSSPDPRILLGIWRFWYMGAISTPGLGMHLLRNTNFVDRILRGAAKRPDVWSDAEIAEFTEPLCEPDRARATVQLYRTFVTREFPAVAAGRYNGKRLTVPTRLVFGTEDFAISKSFISGDFERHADHFELEPVADAGHFIEEEQPELVTRRILDFFSA